MAKEHFCFIIKNIKAFTFNSLNFINIQLASVLSNRSMNYIKRKINEGSVKTKHGKCLLDDIVKLKKQDIPFERISTFKIKYDIESSSLFNVYGEEKWHTGSFGEFEFKVSSYGRIIQIANTDKKKYKDYYIHKSGRPFIVAYKKSDISKTKRLFVDEVVSHIYAIKRINEKVKYFKIFHLDGNLINNSPYNLIYSNKETYFRKKFNLGYANYKTLSIRDCSEFDNVLLDIKSIKDLNFIAKKWNLSLNFIKLLKNNFSNGKKNFR